MVKKPSHLNHHFNFKVFSLPFLLLFLSCTPISTITNSSDVFIHSVVDKDPYKKTIWIKSPSYESGYFGSSFLRALVKGNIIVFYQFYTSHSSSGDWFYYESAYDLAGNKLKFIHIDQFATIGGWLQEDFAIILDRDYLEKSKMAGINIKAFGSRGDTVFTIPGYFIDGFLQKVDAYISK